MSIDPKEYLLNKVPEIYRFYYSGYFSTLIEKHYEKTINEQLIPSINEALSKLQGIDHFKVYSLDVKKRLLEIFVHPYNSARIIRFIVDYSESPVKVTEVRWNVSSCP